MNWQDHKLGNTVYKANKKTTLWTTEKGILEILENTLALPINVEGIVAGYVFRGEGNLLLDTIVETEEGAIGESVDRKLNRLFLMLGTNDDLQKKLGPAIIDDLTRYGFENQQEFEVKAQELLAKFLDGKSHCNRNFNKKNGFIFAFSNDDNGFDILVTKDHKLVFKTSDTVFVSNDDKVVLKGPQGVVVSNNGKSVFIRMHK